MSLIITKINLTIFDLSFLKHFNNTSFDERDDYIYLYIFI